MHFLKTYTINSENIAYCPTKFCLKFISEAMNEMRETIFKLILARNHKLSYNMECANCVSELSSDPNNIWARLFKTNDVVS